MLKYKKQLKIRDNIIERLVKIALKQELWKSTDDYRPYIELDRD
jgi:hypothetical protein